MSVALGRLEGVRSAEVRLNSGLAELRLGPGNRLDPEDVRRTVRDAGFTPRAAEIRVRGQLEEEAGGARGLRVNGADLVFRLLADPRAEAAFRELHALPIGSRVEVVGDWLEMEPTRSGAPLRMLRVRSVSGLARD